MEANAIKDAVFLRTLTDITNANYEDEAFGTKDLCHAIGVSHSQMHRKLKALTGKSTSQFIREFRLEKAHVILQHELDTVSEVAYKVGFHNPSYFIKCYKEYFGYSPRGTEANIENTFVVRKKTLIRKKLLVWVSRLKMKLENWMLVYSLF